MMAQQNSSNNLRNKSSGSHEMLTFWGHVEVFRKILFRCIAVWFICAVVAFWFKDTLFGIVFAPSRGDFILYRTMCRVAEISGLGTLCPEDFTSHFINTELASQFVTHLRVAVWTGVIVACPYLIIQLYGFVAPALYEQEKRYSILLIASGMFLFALGVLLNYFVIFPFSFRFLSTYQVVDEVKNQIALSSYINTLLMLSLMLGILFEIPILAYFLAKLGVISSETLGSYRRHAFVIILIVAAIITPTADIFTLLLVTIPIYALYELSILITKRTEKKLQQ